MSILHNPRRQKYDVRVLQYYLDNAKDIAKSQLSHLEAIQAKTVNLNEFPVAYTFRVNPTSRKTQRAVRMAELGYGRVYAEIGAMEYLDNQYRDNLYGKYYHDVDMKNAHPTLLLCLSQKYGVPTPHLQDYVTNREAKIQELIDQSGDKAKTREDIKKEVIAVLYGANIPGWSGLRKEMDDLATILRIHGVYKDLYAAIEEHRVVEKKGVNISGTYLSYVAQTEEVKCLEAMVQYFESEGRRVDGLAYDGCIVAKQEGEETLPSELLQGAETAIKDRTGYSLRLEVKPMSPTLDASLTMTRAEKEERVDENDRKEYEVMKAEFEKNHYYYAPADVVVCTCTDSHTPITLTQKHLQNFHNWKIPKKGKQVLFVNEWWADEARRVVVRKVAKMPHECQPDEISMFNGFEFEKYTNETVNPEAIATFQQLVRSCAGGTDPHYEYLLKSFARMIQQPLKKSNVCVILSSKLQGCGKETLLVWMTSVMGKHCTAHYSEDADFWNSYNTRHENATMVHLEEVSPGQNIKNSDALKARITQDMNTMNPKGVKAYTTPNIGCHFMTTNHNVPVKIEPSDRRFIIFNPNDTCLKLGKSFWNTIYNNKDTPEWKHSVGNYLVTLDIADFNPAEFPSTELREALLDVVEEDQPCVTFMKQWRGVDESSEDLFVNFKHWCVANSKPCHSKIGFFKNIATSCSQFYVAKKTRTGREYSSVARCEVAHSSPPRRKT
jgi:hypothetical protein